MRTLNCDMGESYGNWRYGYDEEIMPLIDCANVACGFHASDPFTMVKTVDLALRHEKPVGAHPSLPDREGFGRREMHLGADELAACFLYQISALDGILRSKGAVLNHVKPHGIIYGMSSRDIVAATAIAKAVRPFGVPLFGMAGTCHEQAARDAGVEFIGEFFADLEYGDKGQLIIKRAHANIDVERAVVRLRRALETGKVEADGGGTLTIDFQTICMHSDAPNAVEVAVALRKLMSEMAIQPSL